MAEALREPVAMQRAPSSAAAAAVLETRGLSVRAGGRTVLRNVALRLPSAGVVAIVGPSGVGKTTLLRTLNRMVDLMPGLTASGDVLFHGRSVWSMDADDLRARVGMLFQQPVVFPGSIEENVLFGVRHLRGGARPARSSWRELAARVLAEVGLWREVEQRLRENAASLSAGQQQRLCLARALAVDPEVILMDEPTSALDPRSAAAIEELILRLKARRSIALVTHNLAQARRVADQVACLCLRDGAGELLESACCDEAFGNPACREVAEFLNGEAT
jgi:phosphate transport system ATP-binding protein